MTVAMKFCGSKGLDRSFPLQKTEVGYLFCIKSCGKCRLLGTRPHTPCNELKWGNNMPFIINHVDFGGVRPFWVLGYVSSNNQLTFHNIKQKSSGLRGGPTPPTRAPGRLGTPEMKKSWTPTKKQLFQLFWTTLVSLGTKYPGKNYQPSPKWLPRSQKWLSWANFLVSKNRKTYFPSLTAWWSNRQVYCRGAS